MTAPALHLWSQWDRLAQTWIERACDPQTSTARVCTAMIERLQRTEQLQEWMLAVLCGMALIALWTMWELARRRSRQAIAAQAAEAGPAGPDPDHRVPPNHFLPIGGKHVRRR
ncbi:hypothetical protein HNO88_002513 [Novosphingobium chloroacetimidivorans]|uniref:Uncharacterized protein n=1 Tax=Novosphingobium chloroacetimidivorans TaxID=1428314 RepID=A0A7W7KAE0_9SPHN|nr:hypothetical protein [Novosphingobium chloroacetimidivorans]MBB4859184.1 hypothetical protein [Novosphingobium chloroacetimidivorans]